MELPFAVFALLPLGLASLADRGLRRGVSAGFLPLIAALAPVVAKGVGSLIAHKKAKSAEKKAAAYEQQQAQSEAAAERAQFEAAQNSPAALAGRQKFTLQLGKLLGKAGGKEKIPPSIYNYLQSQRQAQNYVGGPAYVPKPTSGAGGWDIAGGAMDALSYLDTTKFGGAPRPTQMSGFGTGSNFQTGQLKSLLQKPQDNPLVAGPMTRRTF